MMRGISSVRLVTGLSLAFIIGASTAAHAQTTVLRGARLD